MRLLSGHDFIAPADDYAWPAAHRENQQCITAPSHATKSISARSAGSGTGTGTGTGQGWAM